MICFVLWIAVIGEKASKYRDDRRYRDLTQATVRSCLIMSSQQDGTWAAVPTNLYHMTTPDPVEPYFIGTLGFLCTYLGFEYGNEILHLSFGQSSIHRGTKMELELAGCACHAGKGRNGRKFPVLVIEVVAGEDVRKQMFFQECVNDGREQLIPAGRRNNFPPAKPCPDLCAVFIL